MISHPTTTLLALFTSIELLLIGCTPTLQSPPPTAVSQPTIPAQGQTLPITAEITIANQHKLKLEVANTPQEQATGLMYRPALPDDQGMIFPMKPARPVQFWMKNVPVALDMVFLHREKIIAIAPQVPPCTTPQCPSYGPQGLVDHVLELRSGRAAELGLKVGDSAKIDLLPSAPKP
jgi:uncharacterized protein